jgi:hypothetical protein
MIMPSDHASEFAHTRAGAAGVGILKTANSLPILAEGAIA